MYSNQRVSNIVSVLIVGSFICLIMVTAISVRGNDKTRQASAEQVEDGSQPKPMQLNGKGQQASEKFTLQSGLSVFEISHDGENNLIVHLLDDGGNKVSTLFNEIGRYQGRQGFAIRRDGQYLLDIAADGNWTIGIEQPRPSQAQSTPHSMSGQGNAISDFVQLEKGLHVCKMTHTGQQRFRVLLNDRDGRRVESVISTQGAFDGSKPVKIEHPGIYFMNVTGDGAWTIDVE